MDIARTFVCLYFTYINDQLSTLSDMGSQTVLLSLNIVIVLILYYMVLVRVLVDITGRVECYG